MATDEPLREQDLPPGLKEQVSETQHSERNDETPPTIGDPVHRPGESSEDAARDAMKRPGDPQGQMELLGLAKSQSSDADAVEASAQRESDDAPTNDQPGATSRPPVDDTAAVANSASATPPKSEEPVDAAANIPPTASPNHSSAADASHDGGSSRVGAAGDALPADEPPADPIDDSDDAVALESSPASTLEEPAASADTPSMTTGNPSAIAAADAPAQAAAGSPPSAPATSPGLSQEQVGTAARSQPHDEDLSPRTTELLTPRP